MKKIITATAILGSLLMTTGCTTQNLNPPTAQEELKQRMNYAKPTIENIEIEHHDNKDFEFEATLNFYDGFQKINSYKVEYDAETDQEGEFDTESLWINNSNFAKESQSTIGMEVFGGGIDIDFFEVEISREEGNKYFKYKVNTGKDSGKTFVEKDEDGQLEYEVWYYYYEYNSGDHDEDDIKKIIEEGKEKYEFFEKALNLDQKKKNSKGVNHTQTVRDYDVSSLTNDYIDSAETYRNYYEWQKDDKEIIYIPRSHATYVTIYDAKTDIELELNFNEDKNLESIEIAQGRYNTHSTVIEKDKYIKSLYTQQEVDEMLELAIQYEEKLKELADIMPEDKKKDEPYYHRGY